MDKAPYTFDRVIRILIGLSVMIGIFVLVRSLSAVLLPFLIAWLLAYLLNPIVLFFQIKLKFRNRILSVFSTLVFLISILTGILWFLIPLVSSEISKLSELIILYSKDLNSDAFLPLTWQEEIRTYISRLDLNTLLQNEHFVEALKKIAPQLWNIINGSLSFVMGLAVIIIVFLYLIFILFDYEKISKDWVEVIPPKYRILVTEVILDLKVAMNRYFRGQFMVALIVGILFAVGFSIIQLPLAILLGLFIGLLNMVPYLQAVGFIPALMMAFLRSAESGIGYGTILIEITIVFIVIQLIQDLLLTPKIMGKVTGMNPAVILLSLSIWGSLIGIVGMIIALPLTTLMISYYKRFIIEEKQFVVKSEKDNLNSD